MKPTDLLRWMYPMSSHRRLQGFLNQWKVSLTFPFNQPKESTKETTKDAGTDRQSNL